MSGAPTWARPSATGRPLPIGRYATRNREVTTIAPQQKIVNVLALVVVVTPELARSVACARALLDDEDLGRNPVLAEWLSAQREALDAALGADDREQLVAVLARLGLWFAAPRGSA